MRHTLLAILLLAICWLPCAAQEKPNIIIFLVDDMGIMDTSLPFLTGPDGTPIRHPLNHFYRTPAMERLAKDGIRFNNFCASSVCSPTRVSILTGQNPARHRTTNWIHPKKNNGGPQGPPGWNWTGLKKSDVTLPRLLGQNGYRTIHIGKGHFGPAGSEGEDPRNLGFTVNIAGNASGHPGSYLGTNHYASRPPSKDNAVPHLEKYHGTETFLTEALTLEAKAQITQSHEAKKPFFLHFAHYAVHSPFESDPRFAKNYVNSGKPLPAQAFATLIEGIDQSLSDLLTHLTSLGIAENTLIFFLGDNGSDAPLGDPHGISSSAPLRGMKATHYEGGSRVPFIAAWARPNPANPHQKILPIQASSIQPQLASVQDLFPTILQLTHTPSPDSHIVDGFSLKTLLTAAPDPTRTEQFLIHYPHSPHRSDLWTSWRDVDWKVTYHYAPASDAPLAHYELYNLKTDPNEQTNLAPTHPADLSRMMQALVSALRHHNALYPIDLSDASPLKPKIP